MLHQYMICLILLYYRRTLYQDIFEYDVPLMHPEQREFKFVQPDECDLANPWKESFKQLVRKMFFFLNAAVLSIIISSCVCRSHHTHGLKKKPTFYRRANVSVHSIQIMFTGSPCTYQLSQLLVLFPQCHGYHVRPGKAHLYQSRGKKLKGRNLMVRAQLRVDECNICFETVLSVSATVAH